MGSDRSPTAARRPVRVALVSMPFGALERPSLGLGLLQAGARRAGHLCSTHYFGFEFARAIGLDDYLWVSATLPYTAFSGDWLFAADLHGAERLDDDAYVRDVLVGTWRLTPDAVDRLQRVRARVGPFLDHCVATGPWADVDVVGFTSTFQQNVASLALARRLAERHPHLTVVFGGANWEGPMGVELHRRFPFVDVVCSGEADHSFPALLDVLAEGRDPGSVAGIVHRVDGVTVATAAGAPIADLDALAPPDHRDFLDAFHACPHVADLLPVPLLETSRGCWWGAHSHCTFCGLNGGSMSYRSKSADRAFEELRDVHEQFGGGRVGFVDNILDMRYFRTFLPRVAEELPGLDMFYEVKASLTNRQLATLARAGVREIQPGIESLSDHVLDLMRKGMTALRNVQLLKWCAEHGMKADWNVLYGVPGETDDDYAEMLRTIDAIDHLEPPTACGPIRLDRFSPYHDDPAAYGITRVRAMAAYHHLYPFDQQSLDRIAYYFDFDHPDGDPEPRAVVLRARIAQWQQGRRGLLQQVVHEPDRVVLLDTRQGEATYIELVGWQAHVYAACDEVTDLGDLVRQPGLAGAAPRELVAFVNECIGRRLMLARGRQCLALAVRVPARVEQQSRHGYRRRIPVAAGPT